MSSAPSEALPLHVPDNAPEKRPRHLRPVPEQPIRIINAPSIRTAEVRGLSQLDQLVADPREQFAPYYDPATDILPSNVLQLRNRRRHDAQYAHHAGQVAAVKRMTRTIGAAFIEAELGIRSFTQLRSWLEHELFHNLYARVEHRAMTKHRAARSGDTASRKIPAITPIGVRAAATVGGEWESSMTIRVGQRARAIAMRLQLHRNRWRVVALEVG